jgi:hypothetical protein
MNNNEIIKKLSELESEIIDLICELNQRAQKYGLSESEKRAFEKYVKKFNVKFIEKKKEA